MATVLELKDLSVGYRMGRTGDHLVGSGLSAVLRTGEMTCLLGLNGAGKSTLLRTICGFQDPLDGEVLLEGKSLAEYGRKDLSTLIAVVMTDRSTGHGLSVEEVVSLGRYPYTGYFGHLSVRDMEVVRSSLKMVGMADFASRDVGGLSDGERQKVMIAKALSQECPVILMDEPTAFLDISSKEEMMLLLSRLAHDSDKSILISTHDVDLARRYADRWWLLGGDGPLHTGTPGELISSGIAPALFNRGDIRVFE